MARILTPSPHWSHGKSIRPDLFQNDFVAPGKWFRQLIQQFQRRSLTSFLSRRLHRRGCKPDQECRRIWKATAWTDIRHFIAGRKPDPDIGEGTSVSEQVLKNELADS
jgi:hypothetical protein